VVCKGSVGLPITLIGKKTKKKFLLPLKIQGDSYSFDIAESKYDKQIALSPTSVKGGVIKFKNYVCHKKLIYWFSIIICSVK
jgi:hypothetical protein